MQRIVEDNLTQIKQLLKTYGVERAYLFGSAATGQFKEDSDVDFIIKFPENLHYEAYYDNYIGLMHSLEKLLKRNIELVAEETLQNPYLIKNIDKHKVLLT